MTDVPYELKFELDIRALERIFLPMVVLKLLNDKNEKLSALRIKDEVVEKMERVFPIEEVEKIVPSNHLKYQSFEFHVSVLYPLLAYLKDQKLIDRLPESPYFITEKGRNKLLVWRSALSSIDKLWS